MAVPASEKYMALVDSVALLTAGFLKPARHTTHYVGSSMAPRQHQSRSGQ
jgi:hypothetical protein